jgi:hypothetical protein
MALLLLRFTNMKNIAALLVAVAITVPATLAAADGYYFTEQLGSSHVSNEGAAQLSDGLSIRAALGMRRRNWAVELWVGGHESGDTFKPRGASDCIECGGNYSQSSGLFAVGADVKYLVPLLSHVEGYIRGGLSHGSASGTLEGYEGRGLGGGVGVQLKGKVSALGLLWAPLFFVPFGPKITGSIYVDSGIDFFRLNRGSDATLDTQLNTLRFGFALGSDF